jgi:N4-(beta-N-acetylglucosaminyl)-L-asparaginase
MLFLKSLIIMCVLCGVYSSSANYKETDIVVNTWSGPFESGAQAAYQAFQNGGNAMDAVEAGCSKCEEDQCDGSVGYGNHPDTTGHTTLDALIMDGATMDAGSVGFVRGYRNVIALARYVMTYTDHTLVVGEGAEALADMIGLVKRAPTTTNTSRDIFESWVQNNCQPNFYRNLEGSDSRCGPYTPSPAATHVGRVRRTWANRENHDTIGIVTRSKDGQMACGTSTNGANHKVAGRLGDSPIIGAGCYVSNDVGGAAATGDGECSGVACMSSASLWFISTFVAI